MDVTVLVKKLKENAVIPSYQTRGSAGFDLHSCISVIIQPKETVLIPIGLSFSIPESYEIQVRPRSGLSLKSNLRVANSPGTIDSDFRGEVCVIMTNTGDTSFEVVSGDRVAQGVLCVAPKAQFLPVEELDETLRRGGFGSTGGVNGL